MELRSKFSLGSGLGLDLEPLRVHLKPELETRVLGLRTELQSRGCICQMLPFAPVYKIKR
jgi:hypothetical protein